MPSRSGSRKAAFKSAARCSSVPCEVLIAAEQVRPKGHFVAEGTKKRRAGLDGDVFFQITGRGQERDPGPRGEAPGTKGGGAHRRAPDAARLGAARPAMGRSAAARRRSRRSMVD